jgi:hypothetical protein
MIIKATLGTYSRASCAATAADCETKKTPLQDRLSIPLTRRKASASSNSAVAINHTTKRRYHMSDYQHIAFCDKRHLIIISLKNPPDLQIETRDYKVADNRKNSILTYK